MKKSLLVSLALCAYAARGDVLVPVQAIATSTYTGGGADRSAGHLIDGSGFNAVTQTHISSDANGMMWMSDNNPVNLSVRFNFGSVQRINEMKIWNFNWKNPANNTPNEYMNRGVNAYDVLVSTNAADPGTAFADPAKWTVLRPGLTLPQAPGLPTYTGAPPVTINADVRWLALRINSSHGGTYIGLSEVRFTASQTLAVSPQAMAEGAAGTTANMTFTLSIASAIGTDVSVAYATSNGTAVAGVDYVAVDGTATITAGTTSTTIDVPIIGNDLGEPDKVFTLHLQVLTANAYLPVAAVTGTILNDDDTPPLLEADPACPYSADGIHLQGRLLAALPLPASVVFVLDTQDRGEDVSAWARDATVALPGGYAMGGPLSADFPGLTVGQSYVFRIVAANAAGTAWTPPQSFVFMPFEALLEAEAFETSGGWVLDTQFFHTMGSSYLLAHGMGSPVADAETTLTLAAVPLTCRIWVRTRDWVTNHVDSPGQFRVLVDGAALPPTFGVNPPDWGWVDGGLVTFTNAATRIALHDLTGYEGRCDAVFVTSLLDAPPPPNALAPLNAWRREQLGIVPEAVPAFDTVIVGGGLAGCAAALAAARSGATVALVQDRPVLGGNASGEIRVRPEGAIHDNNIGTIVNAVNGNGFANSEAAAAQYDVKRYNALTADPNVTLFLNHRAIGVATNGAAIQSVTLQHTQTGREKTLTGHTYIDCTGDAWLGYWAGAEYRMGREAKAQHNESYAPDTADNWTLGTSLMWRTKTGAASAAPPALAWATAVSGSHAATGGNWNWETGFGLDTIWDAEAIRDHMFRAIYGAFWNAKQNSANNNRSFEWIPYVAGKRESRRLIGDHLIIQSDVVNHVFFPDAVAKASWSIDLHRPDGNSTFLSVCSQPSVAQWWLPFRALYSANVPNLMMAGRNISATHVGLGSPRVMHTTAQMGAACGFAAALCARHATTPRGIYAAHLGELQALIGATQAPPPPVIPPPTIILDNTNAVFTGTWETSTYDNNYYGINYHHDQNNGKGTKTARFTTALPRPGRWTVFGYWPSSNSRATEVPIDIIQGATTNTVVVSQRDTGGVWRDLGTYAFTTNLPATVLIRTGGATNGHVIADAFGFTLDFDFDGNGLPDWWERQYGRIPGTMDPQADDDGDGQTNLAEYIAGTDPTDPASRFIIRDILNAAAPETFALKWPSEAGRVYTILYTDDLTVPFTGLPGFAGLPATPPLNTANVPMGDGMRFFKVQADLEP